MCCCHFDILALASRIFRRKVGFIADRWALRSQDADSCTNSHRLLYLRAFRSTRSTSRPRTARTSLSTTGTTTRPRGDLAFQEARSSQSVRMTCHSLKVITRQYHSFIVCFGFFFEKKTTFQVGGVTYGIHPLLSLALLRGEQVQRVPRPLPDVKDGMHSRDWG